MTHSWHVRSQGDTCPEISSGALVGATEKKLFFPTSVNKLVRNLGGALSFSATVEALSWLLLTDYCFGEHLGTAAPGLTSTFKRHGLILPCLNCVRVSDSCGQWWGWGPVKQGQRHLRLPRQHQRACLYSRREGHSPQRWPTPSPLIRQDF